MEESENNKTKYGKHWLILNGTKSESIMKTIKEKGVKAGAGKLYGGLQRGGAVSDPAGDRLCGSAAEADGPVFHGPAECAEL